MYGRDPIYMGPPTRTKPLAVRGGGSAAYGANSYERLVANRIKP